MVEKAVSENIPTEGRRRAHVGVGPSGGPQLLPLLLHHPMHEAVSESDSRVQPCRMVGKVRHIGPAGRVGWHSLCQMRPAKTILGFGVAEEVVFLGAMLLGDFGV